MTLAIRFTVPGEPIGKARARIVEIAPRFNPKTGKEARFKGTTPVRTKLAEYGVRYCWEQAGRQSFPAETPLAITVRAFFQRPKSCPKKRRYPVVKPDWDNLGKLVTDSLNGYAYDDDSRVVEAHVEKRYCEFPETARLEIEVRVLE